MRPHIPPCTVACGALLFAMSLPLQALAENQGALNATYCDSVHPEVHISGNLVWCADPNFWAQHANDVIPYYTWGDQLLPALQQDFGLTSNETFYIVVDAPNGGASTPTPYGPGINVTGDAFYDTAYNVYGFWAYLLVTHEFVNQWAGLVTNGNWPNDWWADHRSPFPNSMDAYVLAQLGATEAATAQKARFEPGGDSADPEVVMFNNFMDTYGQWAYIQRFVKYLREDGMQWGNLRDPPSYQTQTPFISGNPSQLLANYVSAYLSLAANHDLVAQITAAGVGQQPPSWPSGTTFTPYTVDDTQVGLIADAHCAINAATSQGGSAAANALALFQMGNYQGALSAVAGQDTCHAGCPSTECGCSSNNTCVAGFHATSGTTPTPPITNSNTTPPPAASGTPITLAESTGYCVDLSGSNTTDGTTVQTWSCNGTSAQKITYTAGQLQILGKCLQAASSSQGAALQINDCNGSAQQQWVVRGNTITLANTSLCIDVPSNQPSNGRSLWVYTCNGSAAQNWNVQGVSTSTLRASSNTGYCLDVRSSGTADGTVIQIYQCNGTPAQTWTVGGGRLSALGHCLGATAVQNGAAVELMRCNEVAAQNWVMSGQTVELQGSGLCLDLPNDAIGLENPVRVWSCNGSAAQTWVPQ